MGLVGEWLAAAEHRRVVTTSRRSLRPARDVVVLPDDILHAVREDITTTACGRPRPGYILGLFPMPGDVEHCPVCLRISGEAVLSPA